ncbi:MAG: hypothetical protein KF730_11890 [Sphingomonas sp.]|uniref:hypothetical protein n=1 Tax=Sphingomonas sp. TaxID=28214 RepID=UPI0025DBE789|nr:hypothetical protein [Sphingomonas sp.]MBX3565261.1 hypothetical protein [Sphingomonas sp.]
MPQQTSPTYGRRLILGGIAAGGLVILQRSAGRSQAVAEHIIAVRDFGAVKDPAVDNTAAIQRAIEHHKTLPAEQRSRAVIVLDGTYAVTQLIGTQANSGLTIRNGTLVRRPGRGPGANALLSFRQEPGSSAPLENITVADLTFVANAQYTAADIEDVRDTAANLQNGQYCNGVEFFSQHRDPTLRKVRNCQALRISGKRLGKSVVIFDEPENCVVKQVRAEQCLGHAVAVSAISDHRRWPAARRLSIDIDEVTGADTMTLLDLSAITDYNNADRGRAGARVRNLSGKRIRGCSKVSGVWDIDLDGVDVDNSGMQFRKWGAINLVARDYGAMTVANVTARNMRAAVLGNVYSQPTTLRLANITAIDCNEGVNVMAETVMITNLTTDNTYAPIAVSSANQVVVVDGFSFKRISRQTYIATNGMPEYGIQSVPTKSLVLQRGRIENLGNASLAYRDFFIYVPPAAARSEIVIRDVQLSGRTAGAFQHFLRNDSPNVTVTLENFTSANGMFSDRAIANPGKGPLAIRTLPAVRKW